MNRILFLDFDGVLHNADVYLVGKHPILRAEGKLIQHAGLLVDALAGRDDIRIVLSTNWVPWLGFDRTKEFLPIEIRQRVIGATWHSKGDLPRRDWIALTRFYQISTYVERHHLHDWIAVDDDAEAWPQRFRNHLVHCHNDRKGISDPATYSRLLEKLA